MSSIGVNLVKKQFQLYLLKTMRLESELNETELNDLRARLYKLCACCLKFPKSKEQSRDSARTLAFNACPGQVYVGVGPVTVSSPWRSAI